MEGQVLTKNVKNHTGHDTIIEQGLMWKIDLDFSVIYDNIYWDDLKVTIAAQRHWKKSFSEHIGCNDYFKVQEKFKEENIEVPLENSKKSKNFDEENFLREVLKFKKQYHFVKYN